jgi:thiamine pyrophosphokinase
MGKCIIVAAGERCPVDIEISADDYVIAADAGLKYLEEDGIRCDMAVGDFDTLKYVPDHPNVIALKPEKDETDTWEAVHQGIKKGYSEFHIFCALGGRTDHSIANIQLLEYLARNGMKGILYGKNERLTCIRSGEIVLPAKNGGYISVFSLSEKSEGVTIEGLKYELKDGELTNAFPLGVSNEFTGQPARISVRNGSLLVIW